MGDILDLSNRNLNYENFISEIPPNITILNLSNNNFTILPEISDNIEILDLRNNVNLTTLTKLPENLKQIYVNNTSILFTESQILNIAEKNIAVYYGRPLTIDVSVILSKSRNTLNISNLNLSEIKIDIPERIVNIICENNKFTSMFKLPKNITELSMNNNLLVDVNLSEYTNLKFIQIEKNNLTNIKFNENILYNSVEVSNNKLKKLHINNCLKLIAEFNNIEDFFVDTTIVFLNLQNNNLQNINLQNMVNLQKLNLSFNNLSNINLNDCINLDTLYIYNNKLQNIDISNNVKVITLFANNNKLTSINLHNNLLLTNLILNENEISVIDISKNNNLIDLEINNNKLTNIIFNNSLINLYANYNILTTLDVPNTLEICSVANNKFEKFDNLNNIVGINLNNNAITNFTINNINNSLLKLYLANNDLSNINLSNLINLEICYLNDNVITEFPIINNNLQYLNLNDNYITEIKNISNSKLLKLKINNNKLKNINNLPNSLRFLFCEDNYLNKCLTNTHNLKVDCNLYDNYLDVLEDDYKQDDTFTDVIIKSDTIDDIEIQQNKKVKSSSVKCVNPSTFLGDDVNNNNIDIIIVNQSNDKYFVYCYNYTEFFSGTKHNKLYEWENNEPVLNKRVFKEQYTGLFLDNKSYQYAKIYNTFFLKKIKDVKIGTNAENWVSRMHGRDVELYQLMPIKFKDLMLTLDRKTKLTNEQLILKDIEIQDLNIHFRNSDIKIENNTKSIEYSSNNLYISINWNNNSRLEYISNSISKNAGISYNITF